MTVSLTFPNHSTEADGKIKHCTSDTLQEENFHWILNFTISLTPNSLNLITTHYYIFRNLSKIAYMTEIQNSNFPMFNSVEFSQSEPGR